MTRQDGLDMNRPNQFKWSCLGRVHGPMEPHSRDSSDSGDSEIKLTVVQEHRR
ncbi:hypothetical protein SCLCIDRAFT_1207195 [Scleroderma citrinum Foug A]|uniref:Uncharacterized protein n=1 Tax=Scleroderma citrinum Foug A TaxID=1036808 RepID=A0A0C3A8A1_9AGAM|nr:hypothetical protein SCLCIDRAFT_1207195 [Scleroderma citrinum Foug A]